MDLLFSLACLNAFFELHIFLFMLKSSPELYFQHCGTNSTLICPHGILHELTGNHRRWLRPVSHYHGALFTLCVHKITDFGFPTVPLLYSKRFSWGEQSPCALSLEIQNRGLGLNKFDPINCVSQAYHKLASKLNVIHSLSNDHVK